MPGVPCQVGRRREVSPTELTQLMALAGQIGFPHFGPVAMEALVPLREVREMCAADRCQKYGKSWSCPPAIGSLDSAGKTMGRYRAGLLVQTTGQMADDFDLDTIRDTEQLHKARFDTLARQARLLEPGCLPLGAGTCTRCKKCTYPSRPCRYPKALYPSMEAMGLLVSRVCEASGLRYNYGRNTITFTACILIDRQP